jgi:hypothetical protein
MKPGEHNMLSSHRETENYTRMLMGCSHCNPSWIEALKVKLIFRDFADDPISPT